MSNVLIGIIGVILFIGLALAGALFLGSQFQSSTNNSRAAAAIQALSQVASAANMSNIQNVSSVTGNGATGVTSLQTNGYLSTVPTTGLSGGGTIRLVTMADVSVTTGAADLVVAGVGPNNGNVCTAIERQSSGNSAATPPALASGNALTTTQIVRTSGCFTTTAANASIGSAAGEGVVYVRI